jgi:hypothetical protein
LTAEAEVDHNSILYQDTLFTLSIAKDYLVIDAFNLKTKEKLKTFRQLKGLAFDFKKSFLVENSKPIDKDWSTTWSDNMFSKYFFKYINGGTPVISVTPAASDYRFLIGNYVEPKASAGGGFTSVGGGAIGTPGGTVQSPATTLSSGPYGSRQAKEIYFYGYLTKSTFTSAPDKFTSHGRLFEMEKRITQLKINSKFGGECVVNASGKCYLVYLEKKTKNLHVESF